MSLASFIKLFQILKFKILSTTPYKLIDLEILVLCQCNLCYNVQLKSKASSTPHLVPLYYSGSRPSRRLAKTTILEITIIMIVMAFISLTLKNLSCSMECVPQGPLALVTTEL